MLKMVKTALLSALVIGGLTLLSAGTESCQAKANCTEAQKTACTTVKSESAKAEGKDAKNLKCEKNECSKTLEAKDKNAGKCTHKGCTFTDKNKNGLCDNCTEADLKTAKDAKCSTKGGCAK